MHKLNMNFLKIIFGTLFSENDENYSKLNLKNYRSLH